MRHAYAPEATAPGYTTRVAPVTTGAVAPKVYLPAQGPQLVRWGSVFSGTLISVATFSLLTALWLALSFGSRYSFVYSNLSWWIGGTAIFCMFLAGMIAGMTSGARGAGAGAMNGLTTWALVVITVGAVALPTFAIGRVPNTVTVSGHVYSINYLTYWTTFWSLVIGLAAALLGGLIGGALHRPVDDPYIDITGDEPMVRSEAPVTTAPPAGSQATSPGAPLVDENGRQVYSQPRS
jgi:hypothetical protein